MSSIFCADSIDFIATKFHLIVSNLKVKLMTDQPTNAYERRLMREIEALEQRVADIRAEQEALRRQLINARWESHALRDVNRKNSAVRVMVEERILGLLRESDKPVSNNRLLKAARLAKFDLKPNTFRTYIVRMREKGMIESPRRGYWRLSSSND